MNRKILICFLCLMLFTIVYLFNWEWGGSLDGLSDPTLIPTAQYLIQHPLATPAFIKDIVPREGSTLSSSEKVCTTLLPGEITQTDLSNSNYNEFRDTVGRNIRVFLNNVPIPRSNVDTIVVFVAILTDNGATDELNVCFSPNLEPGLHLIRIQTSTSFLGILGLGDTYSYTWAYEVNK